MRLLLLTAVAVAFPVQAQLLGPLTPAPVAPPASPSMVLPRGRDQVCPDGTALNPRLGRCLPTQRGRTLPTEATILPAPQPNPTVRPTLPIPPAVPQQPKAQQLVQEAADSCSAYPGTVATPMPGGYACIRRR